MYQISDRTTQSETSIVEARRSKKPRSGRDLSIESLRGLAILLVLFLHAVNKNASEGFLHFTFSFQYVYMPLFTAISGYVYAIRPVTRDGRLAFLRNKARRILLPFFSVASLQYLVQTLASGGPSGLAFDQVWRIYVFGYAQFWFLQSLAGIFLIVAVIEPMGVFTSSVKMLLSLVFSALLSVALPQVGIVPLDGVVYLLPFFVIGYGLKRFSGIFADVRVFSAALVLTVLGTVLQQAAYFDLADIPTDTRSVLGVGVGLTVNILLFRWRRDLPVLRRLGAHAYQIYLFHGFGMAIGERLARFVPSYGFYAVPFAIKVVSGILISLLAEAVLSRNLWLRCIFLGEGARQAPKSDE